MFQHSLYHLTRVETFNIQLIPRNLANSLSEKFLESAHFFIFYSYAPIIASYTVCQPPLQPPQAATVTETLLTLYASISSSND